ncbi:MAG TPA: hypothetical protein VHE35_07980 [Kofleriaceae bacterium]|nr:hypothetical protein [Kofleriaceae bacterium]
MASPDRRRQRSPEPTLAFQYQLAACCADGGVAAMAIADDDGVPLAQAGALDVCRDVLARVAAVASRIQAIEWTVLGGGRPWEVSMRKFATAQGDLVVCAIGGSATDRQRAVERAAAGVTRIAAHPA